MHWPLCMLMNFHSTKADKSEFCRLMNQSGCYRSTGVESSSTSKSPLMRIFAARHVGRVQTEPESPAGLSVDVLIKGWEAEEGH